MPVPKIAFKSTVLDLELENVELTVGSEIMKVGNLKASLDVADLLRVQLPELMKGDAMGVMFMDCGQKKIQCIKEVRGMTGLGLKEAKDFVEAAPKLLKTGDLTFMPMSDPRKKTVEAARLLENAGAAVEICYGSERIPTVLDRFREMLVEALRKEVQVSDESAEE
jgi:ribosomal protein L7/L12